MLVFGILLLATSSFAAPGILPAEYPYGDRLVPSRQPVLDQSQHYADQNSGIVGVPVNTQVPEQPYVKNAFPNHNQPESIKQNGQQVPLVRHGVASVPSAGQVPGHHQVHYSAVDGKAANAISTSLVGPDPVQGAFGRSHNQYYNVVPESHVVSQEAVQPQHQVGVEPTSQVAEQPRHHLSDHEGFDGVADDHVSDEHAVKAKIVQQERGVNTDGSFLNVWSSDNGINVQEQGVVKYVDDADVIVQQGVVSYVDNDGNQFQLKYVADENGFHVEGPHIPTPPPIPEAIARSLQFIAEHPYVETTTVQHETYQPGQQPVDVDY